MNTATELEVREKIRELLSCSDSILVPKGFEYKVSIINNRDVCFAIGQNKVMGDDKRGIKSILSAYKSKDNSPEFRYAVKNVQKQLTELTQRVNDIGDLLVLIDQHTKEGRKLGQMLPEIWDRFKKKFERLSKESSIVSYQPSVSAAGKSNDDHAEERENIARRRIKKNSGDTRCIEQRTRKEILNQLYEELSSELPSIIRKIRKKQKISQEPDVTIALQYVEILRAKHNHNPKTNYWSPRMLIRIISIVLAKLLLIICFKKYFVKGLEMFWKRNKEVIGKKVEVLDDRLFKNEKESLVEFKEELDSLSYQRDILTIFVFSAVLWTFFGTLSKDVQVDDYLSALEPNNGRLRDNHFTISLIRSMMKSENNFIDDTFQKVKSLLESEESIQCIEKSKEIKEKMNEIKKINEELLNTTPPHTRTESANSISEGNAQHRGANQRWCSIM